MKKRQILANTILLLAALATAACSGSGGGGGTGGDSSGVASYVAFHSSATNLVSGDTNGLTDVFVHDEQTGATTRVNVTSTGEQATGGPSGYPSLSEDGRYCAFYSSATNLVSGDDNAVADVFVHDGVTGVTTRVNLGPGGAQALGGDSDGAKLSADGRYVAFQSYANNLVAGDTNGVKDIFVHDRQTGVTTRVSKASDGTQAGAGSDRVAISADGHYVAFQSDATNLVAGDTNGLKDIFVHDCITGVTTRVNVTTFDQQASDGSSEMPSISEGGRYTAFHSDATNLVAGDDNARRDVFVHDSQTQATIRVNVASAGDQAVGGISEKAVISRNGRYVGFHSDATNLVLNDTNTLRDIFVHDCQTGQTVRVDVASDGDEAQGGINEYPTISADGRFVAWQGDATNLVSDDSNGCRDIFVHDTSTGQTTRATLSSTGTQANAASYDPSY